ncbi:Dihydrofolate reductase [Cardinium endosymbiont cEper1 of Encarsia pergandiella]|uniref:dihydrofolate reductase n=1 Tax=Cardinium endosymbiont of Encarsia pergandiella TaxID=249402 RepID=UPI00027E9B14|nr:dihydrofolate reductase [Cardinium endosymbiont of Encarsia pergandiella]CCM10557.1 Dihydrofolate reductase [Cardinium endosymbiont cEper1 of Encarsia pergandiella]
MIISIIVAMSLNRVIGKKNKLPWHLPADLKEFKKKTLGHHLLMGSHTFRSIGSILPGRISIVVSTKMDRSVVGYHVVRSIEEAISLAKEQGASELFVIGGEKIYEQTLALAHKIYLTRIHLMVSGDTYFPLIGDEWVERTIGSFKADHKNPYDYEFILLEKETIR